MTEIQKINADAKSAFDNKDYPLAFQTLWEVGVSDFVSFAQKEVGNKKNNWLSFPDSAEFFWKEFVLRENVFDAFFKSDSAEQLLHNYFSKCEIQSQEFETRLAKEFPQTFVRAVRVNQAFLKPERIENLSSIQLEDSFLLHRKIWKKIYENELKLWTGIEEEVGEIAKYSLDDILSHCIIWLETNRFNDNSQTSFYHFATVYNFFVELVLNKYPDKNSQGDFLKHFLEVFVFVREDKKIIEESNVSKLLNLISHWTIFKDQVISPYSFDLNIEPVQESELVFFNSTPEAHYKWLLNGVRYEVNQMNYLSQGSSYVEYLESKNEIIIPKGSNPHDENLNRNLVGTKFATLLLLADLGIDSFEFHGTKIKAVKLLDPLLSYSFNRLNRYENSLKMHSLTSKNWEEAFEKLLLESIRTDIRREPFFWMTVNDYKKLNQEALSQLPEDSTEEVIQLFSYEPTAQNRFNRFNVRYDVWQKPFTKIGENLFCPMMFFASNIWFYSFAQEALRQIKTKEKERSETRLMENNFGKIIGEKGWNVKVINDKEANEMKGDIDIFVEDKDTLLFIQLKRTYFRLDLKDAYYDSINTDRKAAKQLNDAEKFLEHNNSIYTIKHKPFKWIVSTSFENIGEKINDCRKVNYFEFLNALKNPEVKELKDLIADLESDRNLKDFAYSIFNNELSVEARQIVSEALRSLTTFESKRYKQLIFSDDDRKTEEYNSLFNEAIKLDSEGKKNEALILFEKCISIKPNDGDAYGGLANTLADMRIFDSSFYAFEKALHFIPNDPYISRNFALALLEAGKFYDGLKLAIQIAEKYPLLGDLKFLYKTNFDRCLKHGFLNPEQLVELHTRWEALNS